MTVTQPTFSRAELERYFDHIRLPRRHYAALDNIPEGSGAGAGSAPSPSLELLRALHRHHIAAVPYENLSLHYSALATPAVSLDPHDLYAKFVANARGRGGYCMESALFFLQALRGLGFDAYPTGVRMRARVDGVPTGGYFGLVHVVLIITLSAGDGVGEAGEEKYVCDVAFGGDGPTAPLPLVHGHVMANLGAQEVRLVHEPVDPGSGSISSNGSIGVGSSTKRRKSQPFWQYQYRNGADREWNSFYCFAETEFLESDFVPINFYTSRGPTFFGFTVIIVKFLLDAGEGEEREQGEGGMGGDGLVLKERRERTENKIVGKLMLVDGTLKRNLGGRTEVVTVCRTESERIAVLREWFGVTLTEEERAGIEGTVTELREEGDRFL